MTEERERLAKLETTVSYHSSELIPLRELKHRIPSLITAQNMDHDAIERHEKELRAADRFRNRIYGAATALGAISGLVVAIIMKLVGG